MGDVAKFKRNCERVISAVRSTPWAILPDKLEAMLEVISLRESGVTLTEAEIQARIADRRDPKPYAVTANGVAVLPLFGVVAQRMNLLEQASGGTSIEQFGAAFDAAVNDSDVREIVLLVDSPGGSVFGVEELSQKIFNARGTKPITAVADPIAASAAYHIATAASRLVVTPSGQVGSIGVFAVHTDQSSADEQEGLKRTIVSAGKYKTEGNRFEPLGEAAHAAMQRNIDEYYAMFVDAVARHRGVSASAVMNGFGQGRMVTAQRAVQEGMADRVATFAAVLSELGYRVSSGISASVPVLNFQEWKMEPKVFGALVRIGMCDVTASEDEARKALAKFYAAQGKDIPESAEAQERDLLAHLDGKKQQATPPAKPAADDSDRMEQINAIVKLSALSPEQKFDFLSQFAADRTISVKDATAMVESAVAKVNHPAGASRIEAGPSERDKFHATARDAILCRVFGNSLPAEIHDRRHNLHTWKPAQGTQRNYRLQSLPSLARACLEVQGYSRNDIDNLSPQQVALVAMGLSRGADYGIYAAADGPAYNLSGDFSNILLDAQNVRMRRSYDDSRTTFQGWMRQAESLADFKLTHSVVAGELSDPKAIPEDGEFEETTFTDAKEQYRLTVWGQVWSISWQAVVNDQLGAFTQVPAKMGTAMRRKQNRLAYGVLKDNPTMADTGALFNATAQTTAGGHANLSTGTATPTVGTLNSMTTKMMVMKGLNTASDGSSFLNLMPRWIIAPPALRGTILELLGSTANPAAGGSAAGSSGVTNIWQNQLDPVIDAELSAAAGGSDTAWYLATDVNEMDHLEYAYLQGLETPAMEMEKAFDRLALRQRIYQAFVVHPVEYRGLQKHAGV